MTIDSADDSKISNRTITTNRISNRTYDSKSNRITKLRRSLTLSAAPERILEWGHTTCLSPFLSLQVVEPKSGWVQQRKISCALRRTSALYKYNWLFQWAVSWRSVQFGQFLVCCSTHDAPVPSHKFVPCALWSQRQCTLLLTSGPTSNVFVTHSFFPSSTVIHTYTIISDN